MRRVLVRQSLDALREFAARRGLDLDALDGGASVGLMTDWYESERADDVDPEGNGDMLLFQWGTYDWGDGPSFQHNVTRQLIEADSDDDDAAIWQLSCTLHFRRGRRTKALGSGHEWCLSLDELDEFRSIVASAPATAFAQSRPPTRVELILEQAG